jgi:hypothetical protein
MVDHAQPLRGSKGSDFEGGTRVCAFLNGGFLATALRGTKITGMMHITGEHAACDSIGNPGWLWLTDSLARLAVRARDRL